CGSDRRWYPGFRREHGALHERGGYFPVSLRIPLWSGRPSAGRPATMRDSKASDHEVVTGDSVDRGIPQGGGRTVGPFAPEGSSPAEDGRAFLQERLAFFGKAYCLIIVSFLVAGNLTILAQSPAGWADSIAIHCNQI